jgi:hypothetical protein
MSETYSREPVKWNITIPFLVLCAIVLATLATYIVIDTRHRFKVGAVHDTVITATGSVRDLLQRNPTPTRAELDDAIRFLDTASISKVWYDKSGRPVDPWGTPFSITFTDPNAPITCTSAGPDRTLHTSDDISYVAK